MNKMLEWEGDVLQRKKYSLFLTKYLENKQHPTVININAPWGAGKTFFIEKWHSDLKHVHPAIYFNAWKNDHNSNPLVSLISCINSQLGAFSKIKLSEKSKQNFFVKSGKILKKLAPTVIKGIVKKNLGEDGYQDLALIGQETEETLSDLSSELTEALLKSHEETEAVIEEFKNAISSLLDESTQEELEKPLFIFIDELDRCRPLFAIELLERVKHIFNIPDVIFVVSTDTEQLSHSIQAVYGQGFNGEIYLRRFFDQIYTLPEPDYISFVSMLFKDYKETAKFFNYSINSVGGRNRNENTLKCSSRENTEKILIFSLFSRYFRLDLRSKKQCFQRFIAIESSIQNSHEIHFAYLIFLIMLDAKYPSKFQKYFLDQSAKDILNDLGQSKENVHLYKDIYTAKDLIEIYLNNLLGSKADLITSLQKQDHAAAEFLAYDLTWSLHNNYDQIIHYKTLVEMANALG
ncbi:KAP family P-loop NTPase fold protein [Methylomonas sp. 2BW1-5-20]|uniref:KAP family P-loop NTPase fold protein n=1 Tax=Methylomonas sp. 2BW1-5-20 TaxID=3376686 RepID=UPI004050F85D